MHVSQGVQLGLGVRRAQFDVRLLDVGPVAKYLRLGVLLLLRMIRIAPKGSKLLLCRRDRMRTDRVSPKKPHFLPAVMVKMDARHMPAEWAGYWSETLER
jgi:hypothetical protein